MKVLKNNFDDEKSTIKTNDVESYPRKLICEYCESELEYEESDITIGVLGAAHVLCPLCEYNNMLDGNENDITLTKDNVEFPTHFFHTSTENGAVDVCNNEYIKKCIGEAIDYFRNNKDEFAYFTGTGNSMIHVYRMSSDAIADNEYHIIISNNYYSTYIPFESEDY